MRHMIIRLYSVSAKEKGSLYPRDRDAVTPPKRDCTERARNAVEMHPEITPSWRSGGTVTTASLASAVVAEIVDVSVVGRAPDAFVSGASSSRSTLPALARGTGGHAGGAMRA